MTRTSTIDTKPVPKMCSGLDGEPNCWGSREKRETLKESVKPQFQARVRQRQAHPYHAVHAPADLGERIEAREHRQGRPIATEEDTPMVIPMAVAGWPVSSDEQLFTQRPRKELSPDFVSNQHRSKTLSFHYPMPQGLKGFGYPHTVCCQGQDPSASPRLSLLLHVADGVHGRPVHPPRMKHLSHRF